MVSSSMKSLSLLLLKRRSRRCFPRKRVPYICKARDYRLKVGKLYQDISAQQKRLKVLKRRQPRRWWVRPVLEYHETHGAWFTTIPIMREKDPEMFYKTFRMTPQAFDRLLQLVGPYLEKRSWRKSICPGERLAITLRYLVSGDCYESLELYFLVSDEAISNIVFETTCVIWNVLKDIVFEPFTEEVWLRRAAEFESLWNLTHCVGAIDGKQVRCQAFPRSASRFYNYKGFFSVILLAVCDAKMKFEVVNVGSSGRCGDGNVFHKSLFGKMLRKQKLRLPPPCSVEGIEGDLPFYFVGDAAFERSTSMITPFKGAFLPPERQLFNYRISRGRGNIENAFGILYKRFLVFDRPIKVSYACAKSIILACCALHNFHLLDEESVAPHRKDHHLYANKIRDDGTDSFGRYKNENPGLEKIVLKRLQAETELAKEMQGSGKSLENDAVVEALTDYFIDFDLPWQWKAAQLMDSV